jgi:hypothetical protein
MDTKGASPLGGRQSYVQDIVVDNQSGIEGHNATQEFNKVT